MDTHSFDLLFEGAKKRELEYRHGPPTSHIYLKSWSSFDSGRKKDLLLLTPDCITIRELEYQIERLHEELEEIRKAAKAKYAKYEGRAIQDEEKTGKWTPKPKPRRPRIFLPPSHYSIEPPRVLQTGLERSWNLDEGRETIDGVSAKVCGLGAVVTPYSPRRFREAVEQIAYFFRREFGYDQVQYCSQEIDDDGHRAYLWVKPGTLEHGKVKVIGACCFRWRKWEGAPPGYRLQWIWFHPHERRNGHLTKAWPYFQKRFGKFIPESPLSLGMKHFLLKQLDSAAFSKFEELNETLFKELFHRYVETGETENGGGNPPSVTTVRNQAGGR